MPVGVAKKNGASALHTHSIIQPWSSQSNWWLTTFSSTYAVVIDAQSFYGQQRSDQEFDDRLEKSVHVSVYVFIRILRIRSII